MLVHSSPCMLIPLEYHGIIDLWSLTLTLALEYCVRQDDYLNPVIWSISWSLISLPWPLCHLVFRPSLPLSLISLPLFTSREKGGIAPSLCKMGTKSVGSEGKEERKKWVSDPRQTVTDHACCSFRIHNANNLISSRIFRSQRTFVQKC